MNEFPFNLKEKLYTYMNIIMVPKRMTRCPALPLVWLTDGVGGISVTLGRSAPRLLWQWPSLLVKKSREPHSRARRFVFPVCLKSRAALQHGASFQPGKVWGGMGSHLTALAWAALKAEVFPGEGESHGGWWQVLSPLPLHPCGVCWCWLQPHAPPFLFAILNDFQ